MKKKSKQEEETSFYEFSQFAFYLEAESVSIELIILSTSSIDNTSGIFLSSLTP